MCFYLLQGENPGEHILILCNAIGSPVDSKYIEVEPKYLAITNYHVIAANDEVVYVWQFRTSFSKARSSRTGLTTAVLFLGDCSVGMTSFLACRLPDRAVPVRGCSAHIPVSRTARLSPRGLTNRSCRCSQRTSTR